MRLGEMIKELRQARGIRQRDLASRLGIQPSVISSIETGARRHVGEKMVLRISAALNLSDPEKKKLIEARKLAGAERGVITIPDTASAAEIQTIQMLASCIGKMPSLQFIALAQYIEQWRALSSSNDAA